MKTSTAEYDNVIISIVGFAGLIPVGLLALWAFSVDGAYYESALQQEFAACSTIADCNVPQQCRINASILKQQYISELSGSKEMMYSLAGYPTIPVGFPVGSEDKFLIPICEP